MKLNNDKVWQILSEFVKKYFWIRWAEWLLSKKMVEKEGNPPFEKEKDLLQNRDGPPCEIQRAPFEKEGGLLQIRRGPSNWGVAPEK